MPEAHDRVPGLAWEVTENVTGTVKVCGSFLCGHRRRAFQAKKSACQKA